MTLNLNNFTGISLNKNGIWYSNETKKVSYPDTNSNLSFQVEDNSFWYQHRNKCVSAKLKALKINAEIFDIGGGNGVVSKMLQDQAFDVILVEPNKDAVQNAQKRGIKHIVCSTIEDINPTKSSLSNVSLFDVLEHIEDDLAFLNRINELLVTNGKLIITVPAFMSLWSFQDSDVGHFRRYTLQELKRKLKRAGFTVEYETYLFSILVLPAFLLRRLPYLLNRKSKNKASVKKNEHIIKKNFIGKFIDKILTREVNIIENNRNVSTGTSAFIVAYKN